MEITTAIITYAYTHAHAYNIILHYRFDRDVADSSDEESGWSGAPLFATQPPSFDASSQSESWI